MSNKLLKELTAAHINGLKSSVHALEVQVSILKTLLGSDGAATEEAAASTEEPADEFDLGEEPEAPAEEPKGPTLEDLIAAFQKYAKKHSREKAGKLLAALKVKSVRDIKAKDYEKVLKALSK